jgi:hypothetical protein
MASTRCCQVASWDRLPNLLKALAILFAAGEEVIFVASGEEAILPATCDELPTAVAACRASGATLPSLEKILLAVAAAVAPFCVVKSQGLGINNGKVRQHMSTSDPEVDSASRYDVMHMPPTRSDAFDKSGLPIVISNPLSPITASIPEVVHDASFCHAINRYNG